MSDVPLLPPLEQVCPDCDGKGYVPAPTPKWPGRVKDCPRCYRNNPNQGTILLRAEATVTYHTHTTYLALLASCREQPADDLPRLVACDWLDEQGFAERAELIRVMIRCRKRVNGLIDGREKGGKLAHELIDLLWPTDGEKLRHQFLYGNGDGYRGVITTVMDEYLFRYDRNTDEYRRRFAFAYLARGFVTLFTGSFAQWLAHAACILPESVGLTVRLTNAVTAEVRPENDSRTRVRLHTVRDAKELRGEFGRESVRKAMAWHHENERDMGGMLSLFWPEVAAWELPPERGGYEAGGLFWATEADAEAVRREGGRYTAVPRPA